MNGSTLIFDGIVNVGSGVVHANVIATIQRGYRGFAELMNTGKGAASIVGSGPSLAWTYQDIVGDVIAVNGAHDFLIGKGIIPKYAMFWDAHPVTVGHARHPHKDVTYLVASRCAPSVFKALEGFNVVVFHAYSNDDLEKILIKYRVNEPMVAGGSAGVTRADFLAGFMGYGERHWFGIDGCYEGEESHAGGGHDTGTRLKLKVYGKEFSTANWMALQAGDLKALWPDLKWGGVKLSIHGTGMIPYVASFMGIKTPDIKVSLRERLWRKLELCRMLVSRFEAQLA